MAKGEMTRRDFLRFFGTTALGISLGGGLAAETLALEKVEKVLPVLKGLGDGRPSVIWFQGAGCTGCSISLLNAVHPHIAEVLTRIINLEAHQTLMTASGARAVDIYREAMEKKAGQFILIVEGAVPTAEKGLYGRFGEDEKGEKTILHWVSELGRTARAVVSVGTCAAFGGIPAAEPNPIGAKSVAAVLGKPVINVPGCPPHPDWIIGTLAHLLLFGPPALDDWGRPHLFFGKTIHANCPRYFDFEKQCYARHLGDDGCLVFLGCKGPIAQADCAQRHWNNGVNWCIGSKAPCLGCVQPEFPDRLSPLYAALPEEKIRPAVHPLDQKLPKEGR
jgi:hydrogenase small subunit